MRYTRLSFLSILAFWAHTSLAQIKDKGETFGARFAYIVSEQDGKEDANALVAKSANSKFHPASMAKIIPVLIAFDKIRAGEMKLDTQVAVNGSALKVKGQNLELKAGQKVKVSDMIDGAILYSANNAPRVLAEAIGGSQERFVLMMNEFAQAVGMRETHFSNVGGVDEKGQFSTAEDMVKLAKHVIDNYPEYMEHAKKPQFEFGGKTLGNTNRLLQMNPSVDGMKTCWSPSDGYGLLFTAGGRQGKIIGVLHGFKGEDERFTEADRLLRSLPK